ncbi:MAG: hypothetical protein LBO66_13645 [Deltaproteobacteria bacterium]|nr:hypothetical protein [Deltaproteobacteria bacterium]
MGEFKSAEKYYNAFLALYPTDSINIFKFLYAYFKIVFFTEKDGLDDAIAIFQTISATAIPKRHHSFFALMAYSTILLSKKARDLTNCLFFYKKLVEITDDFYDFVKSHRGVTFTLIQAPRQNIDAGVGDNPPNGEDILPISLAISLVPPPPETNEGKEDKEDKTEIAPKNANNVYDEDNAIDISRGNIHSDILISTPDNYDRNPKFFNDILEEIVFIQAKSLAALSPFLIERGYVGEINSFFDKVTSYELSADGKLSINYLTMAISNAYGKNASVDILPFAERFCQKCFSFFTEDSAADLEIHACLLYQLHLTYFYLTINREPSHELSLKATENFEKLKKITVTTRIITDLKAKMATNEIARICAAGESSESSRETLNFLLSLKAITDDDKYKTISDEKSLTEQKLMGYHNAIRGLLMKNKIEDATSLFWESVKHKLNYPDNNSRKSKIIAQFVNYFLSDATFDKDKAPEFFHLIKIDSNTPDDIIALRDRLSEKIKFVFFRRNLLAALFKFNKSLY